MNPGGWSQRCGKNWKRIKEKERQSQEEERIVARDQGLLLLGCVSQSSAATGEEVVCVGSQAWEKRPPVTAARVPKSQSLATATVHVCRCPTEKPRIHKLFSSSCLWCPTSASYWQNLTGKGTRDVPLSHSQAQRYRAKHRRAGEGPRVNNQHLPYAIARSFPARVNNCLSRRAHTGQW